jgi:hypothetical protein
MTRALKDPGNSQGPIQAPNGDPDGRDSGRTVNAAQTPA